MRTFAELKSKYKIKLVKKSQLISQYSLYFSQLKHDLAFLTRNDERISLFEAFLNQWRSLLSTSPLTRFSAKADGEKPAKPEETTKPPPAAAPSKSSSDTTKPPPDWNFGMFGPNPSGGAKGGSSQGRPIGGEQPPEQTRMLLFGALGFIAFVSALTYFEMGYKEISWKDFVNK